MGSLGQWEICVGVESQLRAGVAFSVKVTVCFPHTPGLPELPSAAVSASLVLLHCWSTSSHT